MQSIKQTRLEWARILLASQAAASAVSSQSEPVTVRVYERLRSQLCLLMGARGFHAVASRALISAKAVSPALNPVQIAADGSLPGLMEAEMNSDSGSDSAPGLVLIARLLGFLIGLLGETTTLQLIGDVRLQLEANWECRTTAESAQTLDAAEADTAIGEIHAEIDRLRSVGERLENMSGKHAGIEVGLVSVAGNIHSIATVLEIFTLIRNKSQALRPGGQTPQQSSTGFLM